MFKNLLIPSSSNNYHPLLVSKRALTLYTTLLMLFNVFFNDSRVTEINQVSASGITATNVITLANVERERLGMSKLNSDARLTSAAFAKAQNMLSLDYWDHFGPNGESPWDFIQGSGYVYVYAGENLGKGFSTTEGLHQAWMASTTHKANILNPSYQDIGVAIVNGRLQGKQTVLVVQMFGAQSYTNNVAQVDNDNSEVPQRGPELLESGEIRSISISVPQSNSRLTDPTVRVEGVVEGEVNDVGSYKVDVFSNGEVVIKDMLATGEDWKYLGQGEFSQGPNKIEAQSGEARDTVNFSVDSIPPQVTFTDLQIRKSDTSDEAIISFIPPEDNLLSVVEGDIDTYPMALDEQNHVSVTLTPQQISANTTMQLVVADTFGNLTTIDLAQALDLEPIDEPSSLFVLGSAQKNQVNIGFGVFLVGILLVQVYYYRKLKMYDKQSGYLFTIGIWVLFIILGVSLGSFGDVL